MVGMIGWEGPKLGLRKGPWTTQEDKLLTEYVNLHGEGRWSSLARSAGLNRSGKSCRLRWVNYLRPGLKRGNITPQEEGIIIELHALWGNKWSTIARYLPGRTDNEIKNYWRTHFKKKEKSTMKQQKRKAQILKLKQQQKQQQEKPDKDEIKRGSMIQIEEAEAEAEADDDKVNSHQVVEMIDESQGKQEMVFMYPTSEEQWLPLIPQEPNGAASWIDQYLVDEGSWGGLWNLDDHDHDHDDHHQPGNCCMQNQANISYYHSFGGDASNICNGG